MITKEGLNTLLNLTIEANAPTFIIYTDSKSERLNFVCEFIFNTVLKVNYNLTDVISEFEASTNFKINYSKKNIDSVFKIKPHSLLFETNITEQKPIPFFKNELIYFYENITGDLNFDIFSSVFYLISRVEEWQSFQADEHQRFEANNSILAKHNFNLKPVVELWIETLKIQIKKKYSSIIFPKKKFKIISTIDVDNLFAFKNKGFVRTMGAIGKDIVKLNFKNLTSRINVLMGKQPDPFDIYESISEFCLQKNIPLIYFFLFKTGTKYDRTVNPTSTAFTKIFKTVLNKHAIIGLHPSYNSSVNQNILEKETLNFSKSITKKVIISRQHYLRFNIRTTPNQLLKNGIIADFTMGFASQIGFRAGTSQPFYYYDFSVEKKSELLFVPFCAMDGAYFVYNKITPREALDSLMKMAKEVKKVNGLFISVFHERTFYNDLYNGFGDVYKTLHLNN